MILTRFLAYHSEQVIKGYPLFESDRRRPNLHNMVERAIVLRTTFFLYKQPIQIQSFLHPQVVDSEPLTTPSKLTLREYWLCSVFPPEPIQQNLCMVPLETFGFIVEIERVRVMMF